MTSRSFSLKSQELQKLLHFKVAATERLICTVKTFKCSIIWRCNLYHHNRQIHCLVDYVLQVLPMANKNCEQNMNKNHTVNYISGVLLGALVENKDFQIPLVLWEII